jgi:DNA replication initiation complex subunit (GINS family)
MADDVTITYEMLYELLRRERTREELQELDHAFFIQVVAYLKEKENMLVEAQRKNDLFSMGEKDKTQLQLQNIRRLITKLYERRERKILEMALNKSRTGVDIMDTQHLLHEESVMFEALVNQFNRFRGGVLNKVLVMDVPSITTTILPKKLVKPVVKEVPKEKITTVAVKFVKDVPSFVGKELEVYGPFKENDTATLPKDLAELVIGQKSAEKV